MVREPKISCENVRVRLNGTYSGSDSTYWIQGQSIASGSLWDIISGSSTDLRFTLGDDIMDNTATNTVREIKELELVTSCFKTLVQLSGGIITGGFSWEAGIKVTAPHIVEGWTKLIDGFKLQAENILKRVQTFVIAEEADQPNYASTAPSFM